MITYETIPPEKAEMIKELVNELMAFQKTKAAIHPEYFDSMSFETRLLPSIKHAVENYLMIAKADDDIIGYVYCNISPKETYNNDFALFFDMNSVAKENVGCLSQFYIKEAYRGHGVGSQLFKHSIDWLDSFAEIEDLFIYVSNGNEDALTFYQKKGFAVSHHILDGFITVLRNSQK
jgi:GNAT superfamily N-acetyltransferase